MITSIVIYNKSFKNRAIIARQNGKDVDNVIWIEDKFRVRMKEGHWFIQFKKLREKTNSISGEFWTRFIKKKKTPTALEYTPEEWKGLDLSKLIQRGVFFYETNEGEFHPMSISGKEGKYGFNVMSQDNKRWLANEIKDINSLTRNKNKDMLLLGGIVLAILILGIVTIFSIVYMKETTQTAQITSQQACLDYYYALQNITSNPAPQSNQFMDSAKGFLSGGSQ